MVDVGVENIILYSTKTKITWRDSEVGGEILGCALLDSGSAKNCGLHW